MAIFLDKLPGVKVEIIVNGQSLTEYDCDEEIAEADTVTKYVESQSGAEFAIKFTVTDPKPESFLTVEYFIDGKSTTGNLVWQERYQHKSTHHSTHRGIRTRQGSKVYEQRYCFSELKTDDSAIGNAGEELKSALAKTGIISVTVRRVKNVREVPREGPVVQGIFMNATTPETVPEKALKGRALSHQLRYEEQVFELSEQALKSYSYSQPRVIEERAPGDTRMVWEYIDTRTKPFVTYNFLYRSRVALKALCVIPRSPSPAPLEERPVEELSGEEAREVLRLKREREEAARRIKQEHGVKRERTGDSSSDAFADDDEVSFVSAKRVRSSALRADAEIEIVDLT
ncbi:hypothetical protein BDV96DRAFT_685221 [Lophiotrema nucula]|uniref:DUF7918 domain-containing protein n=1 Tax=Lophiotrema nucula TaxID=690887 RepID=A0A6A5ZE68_9PLEO|nr:hypothetical protein BDV96DRAFT_685221 [Lophiotrema nucula]